MPRTYLSFIALALSILYGAGFAALDPTPNGYAAVGGALVAITWIAVGVFGKDDPGPRAGPTEDAIPPFGTPPEDRR
ncbi:hypothetical protein [Pseudactinotalea suaedae]|uniref:hypothetical protein n=1 Tax=Pseudactinotalea suaedae TaxID=1524924 RepID=UPI0012E21967|nr:hypothetical protein [Pseudactinotalea suaedae]